MLLRQPISLHRFLFSDILMGSKHFFKSTPFIPKTPSSRTHLFRTNRPLFSTFYAKPIVRFHPLCLRVSAFSTVSNVNGTRPVSEAQLESTEVKRFDPARFELLKLKMKENGIDIALCSPGQYGSLICPMCGGGDSAEKSLSLFITQDGDSALWNCFRGKCGWKGYTKALTDGKSSIGSSNKTTKVQIRRQISEEDLQLEPLCTELLNYFAERNISAETLRRNSVMQRRRGNQVVIAFLYRRKGVLVNCKYRDAFKNFYQEKDTEKIFYGLDDIEGSSDIIIVEGEMDKLAMEEAGFRNCVSVPGGAPSSVSQKELPPEDQLGHELSISVELQRVPTKGISHNSCY